MLLQSVRDFEDSVRLLPQLTRKFLLAAMDRLLTSDVNVFAMASALPAVVRQEDLPHCMVCQKSFHPAFNRNDSCSLEHDPEVKENEWHDRSDCHCKNWECMATECTRCGTLRYEDESWDPKREDCYFGPHISAATSLDEIHGTYGVGSIHRESRSSCETCRKLMPNPAAGHP